MKKSLIIFILLLITVTIFAYDYKIGFYQNSGTPGHITVRYVTDNPAAVVQDFAVGFYPYAGIIREDEYTNLSSVFLYNALEATVAPEAFKKARGILLDYYTNESYYVTGKDSVDYAADVAKAIGLRSGMIDDAVTPRTFIQTLMVSNRSESNVAVLMEDKSRTVSPFLYKIGFYHVSDGTVGYIVVRFASDNPDFDQKDITIGFLPTGLKIKNEYTNLSSAYLKDACIVSVEKDKFTEAKKIVETYTNHSYDDLFDNSITYAAKIAKKGGVYFVEDVGETDPADFIHKLMFYNYERSYFEALMVDGEIVDQVDDQLITQLIEQEQAEERTNAVMNYPYTVDESVLNGIWVYNTDELTTGILQKVRYGWIELDDDSELVIVESADTISETYPVYTTGSWSLDKNIVTFDTLTENFTFYVINFSTESLVLQNEDTGRKHYFYKEYFTDNATKSIMDHFADYMTAFRNFDIGFSEYCEWKDLNLTDKIKTKYENLFNMYVIDQYRVVNYQQWE